MATPTETGRLPAPDCLALALEALRDVASVKPDARAQKNRPRSRTARAGANQRGAPAAPGACSMTAARFSLGTILITPAPPKPSARAGKAST